MTLSASRRIGAAFAVVTSVASLGCTYKVVTHETDVAALPNVRLRRPLVASVSSTNDVDTEEVRRLCEKSGFFAEVHDEPSDDDDVRIWYDGHDCFDVWELEGPLIPLAGIFQLATLGFLPLPKTEQMCTVSLGYELTHEGAERKHEDYRYSTDEYSAFWPIYSSDERESYQSELVLDRAVASMLAKLLTEVASNGQRWRDD